jgi:hypothetical protein
MKTKTDFTIVINVTAKDYFGSERATLLASALTRRAEENVSHLGAEVKVTLGNRLPYADDIASLKR